jgi:hypothetical protein
VTTTTEDFDADSFEGAHMLRGAYHLGNPELSTIQSVALPPPSSPDAILIEDPNTHIPPGIDSSASVSSPPVAHIETARLPQPSPTKRSRRDVTLEQEANSSVSQSQHIVLLRSEFLPSTLLSQYQLRILDFPRALLCVDLGCHFIVLPPALSGHLKSHRIRLSEAEMEKIQAHILSFNVAMTMDIPPPPLEQTPVQGVDIFENGFLCLCCNQGFRTRKTAENHCWEAHGDQFKGRSEAIRSEIVPSAVQSFFPGRKAYFPCNSPGRVDLPAIFNIVHSFLDARRLEIHETISPATSTNEVSLMEKITNWRAHLEPHIGTRNDLAAILSLKKALGPNDTSYLSHIQDIVMDYMELISKFAMAADLDTLVAVENYDGYIFFWSFFM